MRQGLSTMQFSRLHAGHLNARLARLLRLAPNSCAERRQKWLRHPLNEECLTPRPARTGVTHSHRSARARLRAFCWHAQARVAYIDEISALWCYRLVEPLAHALSGFGR